MFAMRRARILDREDYEDSGNRSHWLPETAIRRENEFGGFTSLPYGATASGIGSPSKKSVQRLNTKGPRAAAKVRDVFGLAAPSVGVQAPRPKFAGGHSTNISLITDAGPEAIGVASGSDRVQSAFLFSCPRGGVRDETARLHHPSWRCRGVAANRTCAASSGAEESRF